MMTLPIESSLVEAPTIAIARGLKSESSILFALLKLLDECLYIGFGLLVGNATQIVQVTGDYQTGDAGFSFDPLWHAISVVRVVRAGLGVVVDDAVNMELLKHLLDVLFLVFVGADDEE